MAQNSPSNEKPKMSKEHLIRTLDAFIELYTRRLPDMPELQEDIDEFTELSNKLKASL